MALMTTSAVHDDDVLTTVAQLSLDEMPVPACVPGTMDENVGTLVVAHSEVRPRTFGAPSPQKISAKERMPVGADEYAATLITASCIWLPRATPAATGLGSF